MTRRWIVILVAGTAFLCQGIASVSGTTARFTSSLQFQSSAFTGATMSPTVAPVISHSVAGRKVLLQWSAVTSSRPVSYLVTRTGPTNNVMQICTGGSAPTVSNGIVSCFDTTALPENSYTYSETPYIDITNSTPWSRPPSVKSSAIVVPRLTYIGSGADVSTTGGAVSVPYPVGTAAGDLLLLVSVSDHNKNPGTPIGWNQLGNQSISGQSSVFLAVAWRAADSATSVTFDPQSNGSVTSVRVVNYGRMTGNTSLPTLATSSPVFGTCAASITCNPSPAVTTNGSNSIVISIVATSAANLPSITTSQGFTVRASLNLSAGSSFLSLGMADLNVPGAGSSPTAPTWTQTGLLQAWAFANLAFR